MKPTPEQIERFLDGLRDHLLRADSVMFNMEKGVHWHVEDNTWAGRINDTMTLTLHINGGRNDSYDPTLPREEVEAHQIHQFQRRLRLQGMNTI